MRHLFIDFETYSATDIKTAGNYKYCEDPEFEILLLGYAFDDGDVRIIDLSEDGGRKRFNTIFSYVKENIDIVLVAHNANFERVCLKEYGFDIPPERFFCTANMSLYCGLPASLGQVSEILDLKDKKLGTGKDWIRYFSIPCKPTATNGHRNRNFPKDNPDGWDEFKEYLKYDVLSEREIFNKLSVFKFPESEQKIYAADQRINDYGIKADLQLAKNAEDISNTEKALLEDLALSRYNINSMKSHPQIKEFIRVHTGLIVDSLNKAAITDVVTLIKGADRISEENKRDVLDVLEMRNEINKTSNAKYTAILASAGRGDRIRGLFRYYGANRTGRWAGRLVQLQNLPQNHIDDLDTARQLVKDKDLPTMKLLYDKPTHILSQLIRTAFIAPDGYTLCVADFSAIEARVIAWAAQEQWRLDLFKDPKSDIYCASASKMFGVPVHKGDELRQRGKVAELALGYGGGVNALTTMDTKKALTEEEKPEILYKWREANPNIVSLWKRLERCAKTCISTRREQTFEIDKNARLIFRYEHGAMTIELPSGRKLFYPSARLGSRTIKGANGDFDVQDISYMGQDQTTGKWVKLHTYGGKLTENIIQAISRDLLANAIFRVFYLGYNIVLHVHDEIAAEIPKDGCEEQTLQRMIDAMCTAPQWAANIPLRAAGYITDYYKKD
jgi:DNA polymerase bacteriophage-type